MTHAYSRCHHYALKVIETSILEETHFSLRVGGGLGKSLGSGLRFDTGDRSGKNHQQSSGVVLHTSLDGVMDDIHQVNPVLLVFSAHAGISLVGDIVECLRRSIVIAGSNQITLEYQMGKALNESHRTSTTQHQTYLFKEVEVDTVSLFLSDEEIPFFESGWDSSDVHGFWHFNYNCVVVHFRMKVSLGVVFQDAREDGSGRVVFFH